MHPPRTPSRSSLQTCGRRGFTLAELIVAAVIAVIFIGGTTVAVGQLLRARTSAAQHQQAMSRADSAASMIAQDIASTIRDFIPVQQKLAIEHGGAGNLERDELLLLMRSSVPVRGEIGVPEGDEFEVQYRVGAINGQATNLASGTLWRRVDQGLDEIVDGGGVAIPAVPGVLSLKLDATDGKSWFDTWDSDSDGLPHGVRVIIVAASDDGKVTATARRVVALDRVPIEPETDTTSTDSGSSGTQTPTNTRTTPTGTGSGTGTGTGGTGTGGPRPTTPSGTGGGSGTGTTGGGGTPR